MYAQDSEYAKERRKWEAHHTEFGAPGRPYAFSAYPTMMYRAGVDEKGKVVILNKEEATTDAERSNWEALGYVHGGQGAAIEAFAKQRQDFAVLAAARNYEDRNMGEKAKAESAAVEASSSEHVPGIPEGSIDRKLKRN